MVAPLQAGSALAPGHLHLVLEDVLEALDRPARIVRPNKHQLRYLQPASSLLVCLLSTGEFRVLRPFLLIPGC